MGNAGVVEDGQEGERCGLWSEAGKVGCREQGKLRP